MLKTIRQTIGRKLVSLGIKWAGIPVIEDQQKAVAKIQGVPHSAVVEAEPVRQDWEPVQSGNVIIAEPDIMRDFRRQKHDL